MGSWMPAVNTELIRSAMGRRRPQSFAERSQQESAWALNRYKYPIGRADTPEMQDAVRRTSLGASS
jgi:hypothetical protein